MIASTLFLAVGALSALVSAQTSNFTTCCDISPSSVTSDVRLSWCRAQKNTCPLLCKNGQYSKNDCDDTTLTYSCVCLSGSTPNISDYAQTLPSLECDSWKAQCTDAHPNDLAGQTFCQSFKCGSRNATAEAIANGSIATGSSSGSASSTTAKASTTGASATSSGTTSATAASTSHAAAVQALNVGKNYGTAGLALGIFAVFGLVL